jgi:formylglycine-generating enzyme required for sulfatase activity
MTISVRCACGAKLKAKEKLAGKKVECPKCKQPLLIKADDAPPDEPPGPLGSPVDLSSDLDPWASDEAGSAPGLTAVHDESDPLGLDELALADPVEPTTASPLGAPPKWPSGKTSSKGKRRGKKGAAGNDKQKILIAAIGGGAALVVVVIGLIVYLATRKTAVADNSSPATNTNAPATTNTNAPPATNPTAPSAANTYAGPGGQYTGGPTPGQPNSPNQNNPYAASGNPPQAATQFPPDNGSGSNNAAFPANSRGPAAREPTVRDDNGLKMKFCLCPPGEFPYGRTGSVAQLTNEFWIGQTEVTKGQWTLVMQTTPWTEQKNPVLGDNYPATSVSWQDAVAFCERMTQVEREQGRLDEELEYRLPTEAEWHYASTSESANGDAVKASDFAWYDSNSGKRIQEVGKLQPNKFGVYDIKGNVSEWTLDRFATTDQARQQVYGGPNPFQWYPLERGNGIHQARGGTYVSSSALLSFRNNGSSATTKAANYGFRVVLAQPAQPTEPPGPSSDELWYVLSNLRSRSTNPETYSVSVDWKRVQGRPEPGKTYRIYIFLKAQRTPVSSVKSFDIDLEGESGTVEGEFPAVGSNGPQDVSYVVVSEEEGHGSRFLASGELGVRDRASDPQPPAR